MDNYAKMYMNTIWDGIKKTKFKINNKISEADYFFNELTKETERVKNAHGRLFFFGNGASAAFSNHMALDWSKNGGILALSLSDSSLLTALANDYDFEGCFLEFLKINNPCSNDLVITTSSSGNSKNVINVLEYCKQNKITTFGLSGLNENNMTDQTTNYSLYVPMKTYGMVECIHQFFHHLLLDKAMHIEEWNKEESQNMDANNFKL